MSWFVRLRRRAPRWMRLAYARVKMAREFYLDFREYSSNVLWTPKNLGKNPHLDDYEYVKARLTVLSHGLEKGMTFPAPRRPFGTKRMYDIEELLQESLQAGIPVDASDALLAVEAVRQFNDSGSILDEVSPLSSWEGEALEPSAVENFVRTRHSVRNFDLEAGIDRGKVREVIRLAGLTPSVCNRRSYRAHFYDDQERVAALLALQNGNRGFVQSIPGLFVITERRSGFLGSGERNQRWIDGGLFAMSVVWLCHALGLGTCFLNWSETHDKTTRLRAVADIPDSEDVIVMIAVGQAADGVRAARSPERPLDDILVVH